MSDSNSILSMTEHAGYVWPTYVIAALVLGGVVVWTLRSLSRARAELAAAEAAMPSRDGRGDGDEA